MTRRYDGFRRPAYAALSAGLMWLSGRAVRASDPFIALAHRKGVAAPFAASAAELCLALAKSLCEAGERADTLARPARRT